MVKRNPALEQRRKDIMRKHRNATSKVSRMRAQGADIAGTAMDIRRNPENIKRYNAKQLDAYENTLDEFNDRSTGYVALKNEIITRQEWQEFKSIESQLNAKKRSLHNVVKDVKIDSLGVTVSELKEIRETVAPTMGTSTSDPTRETDRTPEKIASKESLAILRKQMLIQLSRNLVNSSVSEDRATAGKMAKEKGMEWVTPMLETLSDKQFYLLWRHTSFADSLSTIYHNVASNSTLRGMLSPRARKQIIDNEKSTVTDYVTWAKHVDY